jgi:LCP family protein required for cell wall assembly
MPDGRHSAPRGRSRSGNGDSGGTVANESRLAALGVAVDKRNGVAPKTKTRRKRRKGRIAGWTAIGLVVIIIAAAGGGYYYINHELGRIKRDKVKHLYARVGNTPFNVLIIGSDSRAGLTGSLASQTGANNPILDPQGQRSDIVMIVHIDPGNHSVNIVSIPRDTMVKLLANQNLYTNYNRINVNYGGGPTLLVQTIEANFGIPINHVVQVSFAGLVNASTALGGIYLDFPYPAKDDYSGLRIHHAGCQLVTGFQTLAVVRSRHYEYYQDGQWMYDGSSDFGRIERQDTFIRAMMEKAKGQYDVVDLGKFLNSLTSGIIIDSTWTNSEILDLAYDFKNFQAGSLKTYTLPVVSDGDVQPYGDVLSEQEPEAQQLLVKIFGSELKTVTAVPPNGAMQPLDIPYIPLPKPVKTTTTSSSTTTTQHHSGTTTSSSTTTTIVPAGYDYFNPVPCTPK